MSRGNQITSLHEMTICICFYIIVRNVQVLNDSVTDNSVNTIGPTVLCTSFGVFPTWYVNVYQVISWTRVALKIIQTRDARIINY